ncbi:MAG TPA: GNAT family N-acetyltransferase, partial [Telluria sp.]|nr:GNAT family N-acetyltransferase [Telluria sp.]
PDELAWVNQRYAEVDFVPSTPQDRIAIAEIDGVPAGIGRVVPVGGRNGELGGMVVFPEFRRRGVAQRIVAWLLALPDFDNLYCLPFAELESLYGALGFCRIDEAPEDVITKHRWCNEHYPQPVLLMVCRKPVHDVIVMGGGFAGLCMGVRLKEAGFDNFVILEKDAEAGGTWRVNDYPGAACDVPSHLYSFSFAQNPHWTRKYPGRDELWAYTRSVIRDFGLAAHLRTGTELLGADFNEAGGYWTVRTSRGEMSCKVLVSASGALSRPSIPDLPGLASFEGKVLHSACWDHGFDLTGKRVAVIGTGASAIQFIPEIAPQVAQLDVFQRSAQWIIPRHDRAFTAPERWLLAKVEPLRLLYRALIYAQNEARLIAFTKFPGLMKLAQWGALRHLRRQTRGRPDLQDKLTPRYTMGCKRILMHNAYYPALTRPNVALFTDAVREVRPRAIVTASGEERPVDAIIFGTGFDVEHVLGQADIRGRGGVRLLDLTQGGLEAYKGAAVAGFPNFFMITGPNTGLGHNSMIYMIESGVQYVLDAVTGILRGRLHSVDVTRLAQERYNERLQRRLRRSVWNSGCTSWYLNAARRNYVIWPGFSFTYRALTRRFDAANYRVLTTTSADA